MIEEKRALGKSRLNSSSRKKLSSRNFLILKNWLRLSQFFLRSRSMPPSAGSQNHPGNQIFLSRRNRLRLRNK
jgi:hypothetical protein